MQGVAEAQVSSDWQTIKQTKKEIDEGKKLIPKVSEEEKRIKHGWN